jgi:hypothetical protein
MHSILNWFLIAGAIYFFADGWFESLALASVVAGANLLGWFEGRFMERRIS